MRLQTFSPATVFLVQPATAISASGNGIEGNNSAVWTVTNNGSVTSTAGDGISLTPAGATIINNGSIQSASNKTAAYFNAGGTFAQSVTGRLTGGFGVIFNGGMFTATNAGNIQVGQNGLTARNGASGTVNNAGGIIATTGAVTDKAAVLAQSGGSLTLSGGSVSASGQDSRGLYASGSPGVTSTLVATNVAVSTNGQGAMGVRTNAPAQITLNNVTIQTQGNDARGVLAQHNGTVVFNGGSVNTLNDLGDGMTAVGGDPGILGGTITATDVVITTAGARAYGAAQSPSTAMTSSRARAPCVSAPRSIPVPPARSRSPAAAPV